MNISLSISFNISFGCSKERSRKDGSFEYSQHFFRLINKEIYEQQHEISNNVVHCMCNQQRFRSACTYAQSDLNLCKSLEYLTVKPLTEQHLEFLSLKGGYTGMSEYTLVKMLH